MWFFTLLLLVGAVVAHTGHEHGWETGKQYQYHVQSRTLSTLDELNDQTSGILIRAVLTIQAVSSDKLQATLIKPQFSRIHTQLTGGTDSEIPNEKLNYQELPLSGKPFEIVVKHGMIRDLLVEKDIPTWELNLLKGIVSQLQLDTQGENALNDRSTQEPKDGFYASYKTMEDTVGGKCEVLYDISPLSAHDLHDLAKIAPLLEGNEDKQLIMIRKTRNYNNCKQQRGYHFGLTGRMSLTQKSHNFEKDDRLTTKSTDSRIVISGDLKQFTIQSSVTMNNIFIKSERPVGSFIGSVYTQMDLTLVKMEQITSQLLPVQNNLVSTGNLLYTYNNPLTEIEQNKQHEATISKNSQQIMSSESSSSEQNYGKYGQKHRRGDEDSSSATSSSEEFHHVQTVPSLSEAPRSMTPLDLALQGVKQDSPNMVEMAQKHAREIIHDLHQSNNVLSQDTLEKFTNFVNVLRLLNDKQIIEVTQGVISTNVDSNAQFVENSLVKNDAWTIVRDGVAQTGTGPALLTIIKWIQNGQLTGIEAARVISKIPKVVRIPSVNYIDAVFQHLVINQNVQQQEFASKIAPIAFSELVRKAQIDKRHSQSAYPIYNFGKFNPETDKVVVEHYIPYMEKQMHLSIKNGDNAQAQAYIVALGNFGHSNVLKVFEPYLEGEQQTTTYLRTLMVSSLRSLVRRSPQTVASVLYKIYLNEQEAHEVRCAAVHLYMLTDPPLVSMLRMAKYTNYDKSNDVNAAVKSSIISLSKWDHPQFQHLTQKARYARRLLTSKKFSSTNSQGIFKDTYIMQIIGSEDSSVPKNVYINALTSFGNVATSVLEMEYGVSSVKQLIDIFEKPEVHQESAWLDSIRQSLNMQEKTRKQVEGNVRVSTIFGSHFYPFDQQGIEKFVSKIKNMLKHDQNMHINRMDSFEETLSFPTESGLPFTYTITVPTLTRISGSKKNLQGNQGGTTATTGIVNVLLAQKLQTRFGVVVAHEQKHYIAGVDRNTFVHLPMEYNLNVQSKAPFLNVEMKVHADPNEPASPLKLMHRSVVPFTAQMNLLNLQPALKNHAVRIFNTKEVQKSTVRMGTLNIILETDDVYSTSLNSVSVLQLLKSFFDESVNYKMIEVHNMVEKGNRDDIMVNVAYDELKTTKAGKSGSIHDTTIDITDKHPNSETRRMQLLHEVGTGMKSIKASVFDIAVEIPFLKNRQVLTIALGESDVEQKTQYIVYWNRQSKSGEVLHEALVTGSLLSTQEDFLKFKSNQMLGEDQFTIIARAGKNYKQAEKIVLTGQLLQTDSLKEMLLKSKTVKQCLHEMKDGKGLLVCQKAMELALKKNLLQLSIKLNSDEQVEIANMLMNYLGEALSNADVELKNSDLENEIKVEFKMTPDYENLKATVQTPNLKFILQDTPTSQMLQLREIEDFENEEEEGHYLKASCSVSESEIVTFDHKNYPLHLGRVWHVLMTPDQTNVPQNMRVMVFAREVLNGIQVRILLENNKEYTLQQSGDHLQTLINGQMVELSQQDVYQDTQNGEVLAELFVQPDGSVMIKMQNLGVTVVYDGRRARLLVTDRYRNAIRGLCGNFDKQSYNDFLTPRHCFLQNPEEFAATFALLDDKDKDSLSRTIMQNKEKANLAVCTPLDSRQTNVINDREAGRQLGRQFWGYHLNRNQKNQETIDLIYRTKFVENDQEICFSVRPLQTCPANSNPVEMKEKIVGMHCMPKTEAAYQLKQRVQNGANPSLEHKTINKKWVFGLPTACQTY